MVRVVAVARSAEMGRPPFVHRGGLNENQRQAFKSPSMPSANNTPQGIGQNMGLGVPPGFTEAVYSCPVCSKKFDSKTFDCDHKIVDDSSARVDASSPGEQARDKRRKVVERQPGQFACTLCSRTYARREKLLNHMSKVHNIDPGNVVEKPPERFACTLCNRTYSRHGQLVNHVGKVHKDGTRRIVIEKPPGRFACTLSLCDRTYTRRDKLVYHIMKVHNIDMNQDIIGKPPERFVCTMCYRTYSRHGQLLNHMRRMHKVDTKQNVTDKPRVRFACTLCNRTYTRRDRLVKHMGKVHNIDTKLNVIEKPLGNFPCTMCYRTYSRRGQLLNHMVKMHKVDPKQFQPPGRFPCTLCYRTYSKRGQLLNHVSKVHKVDAKQFVVREMPPHLLPKENRKEKPIECPHCKEIFNESSAFVKHIRALFGQESRQNPMFRCEVCGMMFHTGALLRYHLHRNHAPPVQSGADGRATDKHNVVEKPPGRFPCTLCKRIYVNRVQLSNHMRRVHKVLTKQGLGLLPGFTDAAYSCSVCSKKFPSKTFVCDHDNVDGTCARVDASRCARALEKRTAVKLHRFKVNTSANPVCSDKFDSKTSSGAYITKTRARLTPIHGTLAVEKRKAKSPFVKITAPPVTTFARDQLKRGNLNPPVPIVSVSHKRNTTAAASIRMNTR